MYKITVESYDFDNRYSSNIVLNILRVPKEEGDLTKISFNLCDMELLVIDEDNFKYFTFEYKGVAYAVYHVVDGGCKELFDGIGAWQDYMSKYSTDESNQSAFVSKGDKGKPRLFLVPPAIIEAVGKVRTYGTEKYKSADNWKEVGTERYQDALMRHLVEYMKAPNSKDEESNLYHLEHIACNVAFLLERLYGEETGGIK